MMKHETPLQRFFFGAHIRAPWPHEFPEGRIIPEETRHITLAFLGKASFFELKENLANAPLPLFQIGPVGIGKELVFLPEENSRVAALSVHWLSRASEFNAYQKTLASWLQTLGYPLDPRPFFPHLTIARAPFDKEAWRAHFFPLPLFATSICLYESLGNLTYRSLWQTPLLAPFEEYEHTADIAFLIRGASMEELHQHAQIALAFHFPALLEFFPLSLQNTLDETIIALNRLIAEADAAYGCPFKAVSFHDKVSKDRSQLYQWEMIVDV